MELLALGAECVYQALEIYASSPQMQSRAAYLQSLGDVLKIKGELDNARTAYCEGLAFWEAQNHAAWTARFRERLESLDSQPHSDSKKGILIAQSTSSVSEREG